MPLGCSLFVIMFQQAALCWMLCATPQLCCVFCVINCYLPTPLPQVLVSVSSPPSAPVFQHTTLPSVAVPQTPSLPTLLPCVCAYISDQPVTGYSVYNVTPDKSAIYFNKIQCFCFEMQRLRANVRRRGGGQQGEAQAGEMRGLWMGLCFVVPAESLDLFAAKCAGQGRRQRGSAGVLQVRAGNVMCLWHKGTSARYLPRRFGLPLQITEHHRLARGFE